jgi:hypothetical protein
VCFGVKLRCFVGVIFGMSGMTSGSVSMMRGGFVLIILVMLCSFGVMLGRLVVVFSGLLVVVRSLMVRHFNLHFSSRWWTRQRRLLMERAQWAASRPKGQFGESVMTVSVAHRERSDPRLDACGTIHDKVACRRCGDRCPSQTVGHRKHATDVTAVGTSKDLFHRTQTLS